MDKTKIPPISLYTKYLNISSIRFNMTLDECKDKYGLFSIKQWEELLIQKYSSDTTCSGNHKADNINSRIMELADGIATELAQKDWETEDRGENFYVEEENGDLRLIGDAHEIWEKYYDKYVDILYSFSNKVIQIDTN